MIDTGCSVSIVKLELVNALSMTIENVSMTLEVMNCSVLHTESKVVLESVVVGDSRSDVKPLNAQVLRKLPLDLD